MREVLGLRELGGDDAESGTPAGEVVTADEGVGEPADAVVGQRGWRRRAAAGVVVALFVGVGYVLTVGRAPGWGARDMAPAPASPAGAAAESVEDAARAALDAWAQFADTGDVDALGVAFDRGGPQFARLRAEAPAVATRPASDVPYAFTAMGMQIGAGNTADERVVVAEVVVSKPGETDQRFAWELVMRKGEGRWRLWTVRDRAVLDGVRSGGRP